MLAGDLTPGRSNLARQVKGEKPDEYSETNLYFLRVVEISKAYITKQIQWFWDTVSLTTHRLS